MSEKSPHERSRESDEVEGHIMPRGPEGRSAESEDPAESEGPETEGHAMPWPYGPEAARSSPEGKSA